MIRGVRRKVPMNHKFEIINGRIQRQQVSSGTGHRCMNKLAARVVVSEFSSLPNPFRETAALQGRFLLSG